MQIGSLINVIPWHAWIFPIVDVLMTNSQLRRNVEKSGLCQNNCLGIKWLSLLHCQEVRSVITFSFDSGRKGPEDLKYLELHQQTADLVGTTGTVRIVKGNAQRVNVKGLVAKSCLNLCDPMDCSPTRLLCPWDSPGKNTGVGCHFLLQGIFLTWGLNLGLPHCRQFLYHLSHWGSPQKG